MFSHFDAFSYFHGVTFTQNADFSMAEFTKDADFSWARFTGDADFSWARFTKDADFSRAIFTQDAGFYGAAFIKSVIFSKATFQTDPIFVNIRRGKTYKARFSCKADPEDYRFEVNPDSPCKIETEEKEYNGVKFRIPKGAILFDPDEPSDQEDNNSKDS